MRIRRALEVAFYPRRLVTAIFVAIAAVCFLPAIFVEKYPLLTSISFTFGFLLLALAWKLIFSGIFGQIFGVIVGPYRDDLPVGTMVLLAILLMPLAIFFAAPLMMEAAARSGIPM